MKRKKDENPKILILILLYT